MGVHFILGRLLDGTIVAQTPEVLVYEPTANGRMKLVAPSTSRRHRSRSSGRRSPRRISPPMSEARSNTTPRLVTLHVWIWYPNPSGLFSHEPVLDCNNA